jgi:hypothetical protein
MIGGVLVDKTEALIKEIGASSFCQLADSSNCHFGNFLFD